VRYPGRCHHEGGPNHEDSGEFYVKDIQLESSGVDFYKGKSEKPEIREARAFIRY
jgi:hypothetical protein